MQVANDSLELELPVESASVTAARHAAGDFAVRMGAARQDVELAVSEAVSNSVLHAFPEGADGTIQVRGEVQGADLVLTVRDDGTGLRPDLENKGFGLGLPLIARVSKEYRIEDVADGGAVVTMRFVAEAQPDALPKAFAFATAFAHAGTGRVAMVEMTGDLDLPASPEFEAALSGAAFDECKGVVIDLMGLRFMDSSGIRMLLLAGERFRQESRRWALALADGSAVRRVLTLSGVEEGLPLCDSRDEALAAVSEGTA